MRVFIRKSYVGGIQLFRMIFFFGEIYFIFREQLLEFFQGFAL
ncbi:hypothetical protein MELB17_11946 [Marinobacter sp. ELB17]|nr:hypothetical protein MELB17_11946 [Marinobacter sp. ELB17]